MRRRGERVPGRRAESQRLLPFLERTQRRDRQFQRGIVALTALAVAALLGGTARGRYAVAWAAGKARREAMRQIGLEPPRAEIDAELRARRRKGVEQTQAVLERFYRATSPQMRRLFDVAGMDPRHGLVRWGRGDAVMLLSSKVFAADDRGRSYRLRPDTRAVWLRQVTLHEGPFGLFLVPDTSEVRAAAEAAGAIVDRESAQSTNSWGLRGPEPDTSAAARGLVLGDSFMQGMFIGDDDTPPLRLERVLRDRWEVPVSILNTGHLGYCPEQYDFTLKEYGDRFRPHFVVVSVCPNDFGEELDVLSGGGDGWDEARYWLGEVVQWCRSRSIPCILAPIPCDVQFLGNRRDGYYPGRVCNLFEGGGLRYCDPLNAFIDEHLRLMREGAGRGLPNGTSPLYNGHIADHHFSPMGAALWAREVGRRVALVVDRPRPATALPPRTPGG
jgi:hypothetical protein